MKTTIFAPFKTLDVILLVIIMTLLVLASVHGAQSILASVGWHGMASVSWTG
jgi:hypothetical protein